jgi:hypothetical protein
VGVTRSLDRLVTLLPHIHDGFGIVDRAFHPSKQGRERSVENLAGRDEHVRCAGNEADPSGCLSEPALGSIPCNCITYLLPCNESRLRFDAFAG